jgi:broad specificity phosphatase PhoE
MGMDLAITEAGAAAARALGARLGSRIARVHTSAVHRCAQTSRQIVAGAGVDLTPVEDPLLGVPSTFLYSTPEAEQTLRRLGFDGFCEHLMKGDSALPGMPHPAEGAARLREHALGLADRAGLHLMVTHDAMIATVVARSFGRPLTLEEWPVFLEAAAVWRDGDRVMVAFRDECRAAS